LNNGEQETGALSIANRPRVTLGENAVFFASAHNFAKAHIFDQSLDD
jgi:hypothetical protein